MAISLVATASGTSVFGNAVSTTAIDTTGATLLVISVSWYSGTTTALTISDSRGNTYTPLTLRNAGNAAHRFYYCANPTSVGSSHGATASATGIYAVVTLSAYAGTAPTASFDVENGATATSGTSLATGSVTPAANGALIVSGWAGMNNTSNPTVGSGLTKTTSQNPSAGTCIAGAMAYLIQTTAAAINPTWSWTGTDHVAESVAVFKATAAAAVERVQSFLMLPV